MAHVPPARDPDSRHGKAVRERSKVMIVPISKSYNNRNFNSFTNYIRSAGRAKAFPASEDRDSSQPATTVRSPSSRSKSRTTQWMQVLFISPSRIFILHGASHSVIPLPPALCKFDNIFSDDVTERVTAERG